MTRTKLQPGLVGGLLVVLTFIFFILCLIVPTLGGMLGAALFREEAGR